MTSRQKHFNHTAASIVSLYLLAILALGSIYLLYSPTPSPPTYTYKKALPPVPQAAHVAMLTIPSTISYGRTGHNSLHKITHIIELLCESNTNKGLLIHLIPDDTPNSTLPSEMVNHTILQQALNAYKKKTNRKIIVSTGPLVIEPQLLILAIADHIIVIEPAPPFSLPLHTAPKDNYELQISHQEENDPPHPNNLLHDGIFKITNDKAENGYIANAYDNAIEAAKEQLSSSLILYSKETAHLPALYFDADTQEITITEGAHTETVPIVDLTPYTPQKSRPHRRTTACFETIMISGAITPSLVEKISPLIQSAQRDPNVKGTIIVWNSEGGELASAAQLLALLKTLAATKPLVHLAAGDCASGAYLLAAATGKQLIAYPNSRLGSIGAKSPGNPASLTNEKQQEIAQQLRQTRQWFIKEIAQNRASTLRIKEETYRQRLENTEARIYIAYRALEELLIDKIGTLQDAIDALKQYTELDLPVYYSQPDA